MHTTPSVSFDDIAGSLPADCVSKEIDLSPLPQVAKTALETLDPARFTDDLLWRDSLCMTGSIRTFSGKQQVLNTWAKLSKTKRPSNFDTKGATEARFSPDSSAVAVPYTFQTQQDDGLVGICSGSAFLVRDKSGDWKVWMIATMLEHFQGLGDPDEYAVQNKSADGVTNGVNGHARTNGHATTNGHGSTNGQTSADHYDVLIIGAGQNGLCLAGRLAALGVSYVIIEKNAEIGYSWTGKYDAVRQHTVRQYNHLPFEATWSNDEELLLPAKKVAEGFQRYVRKYDINVWLSSTVEECERSESTGDWTLQVIREGDKHTVQGKHLALALGAGLSMPRFPNIANQDAYTGEALHATRFKNAKAWRGRSGTVVGSGTTAHDIAQDMLNNGVSPVNMIQRTKTAVFPVEWHIDDLSPIYNDNTPTGLSDRLTMTMPTKLQRDLVKDAFERGYVREADRFAALERAGFKVDFEAHLLDKIFRDYGGYYIDVGTSKEIADGNIKVKSGVPIKQFTSEGLAFEDGTELKSDVIVLATGYEGDYRVQAAPVIGMDIASKLGDFWGLDSEGEVRGIMKPMAPGLWFLGGAAVHARWWSRFVALQIQADLLGKPFQPLSSHTNGVQH